MVGLHTCVQNPQGHVVVSTRTNRKRARKKSFPKKETTKGGRPPHSLRRRALRRRRAGAEMSALDRVAIDEEVSIHSPARHTAE